MGNGKLIFIDVETTGLDDKKNDIIKLAYIVEINGEVVDTGDFKCQPFDYDNLATAALKINEVTVEDLRKYPEPKATHTALLKVLGAHVDKYNKTDKFIPVGYNVKFDIGFLRAWFKKCNCKFFGSYFDAHPLDVLTMAHILRYKGIINLENYKLVTVAKHFGIEHDSHDPRSDVKATREIFHKVMGYFASPQS